ncbi:MAG: lipoyl(octanoyl) transferase LipB [Synergistetes bacterium]|nr:lipoyl(octanoyl) transferase LipB [Synergistota bacterium]
MIIKLILPEEPIDYEECFNLQRNLVEKVLDKPETGYLLLLEHTPVLTLGRRAKRNHILASEETLRKEGIKVVETDRGGDITYHGPGQLISYPIICLDCGVKEYVWRLEEAIIRVLNAYGIKSGRKKGYPGVWVDERRKIASIGIGIRRRGKIWVSYHGTAFNVSPNLRHFLLITPCGLSGVEMVSIKSLTRKSPSMKEIKHLYAEEFKKLFPKYEMIPSPLDEFSYPR